MSDTQAAIAELRVLRGVVDDSFVTGAAWAIAKLSGIPIEQVQEQVRASGAAAATVIPPTPLVPVVAPEAPPAPAATPVLVDPAAAAAEFELEIVNDAPKERKFAAGHSFQVEFDEAHRAVGFVTADRSYAEMAAQTAEAPQADSGV